MDSGHRKAGVGGGVNMMAGKTVKQMSDLKGLTSAFVANQTGVSTSTLKFLF